MKYGIHKTNKFKKKIVRLIFDVTTCMLVF